MNTIKTLLATGITLLILSGAYGQSQEHEQLPFHYAELTAPDFIKAVDKSGGICILPAGILEKHGPHLPLGTDLILAREISARAAKKEYAIVFPEYYFGQIYEAKHQPGTMAYGTELVWNMLEQTCEELARNGIKKIIIVNGHGGNNNLFSYFCQAQLAEEKDYVVVFFQPDDSEVDEKTSPRRTTNYGGHADEVETSMIYAARPDLVRADRASSQSGRDQERLSLPFGYTGIWWYASFPNHYAGDGSSPKKELGEMNLESRSDQLVTLIRALKEQDTINELQQRFYREASKPLETKQ